MLVSPNAPQPDVVHISSEGIGFTHSRLAQDRPRVVVIGGGLAGMAVVSRLAKCAADIILIDRHDHHLLQPLRNVVSHQANVRLVQGEVNGIDKRRRLVHVGQHSIRYDHLVVATGARSSAQDQDAWTHAAPALKTLEDTVAVRDRILSALQQAETAEDPSERRRLLTFVVIGAGPTGVELAGAIAEFLRHSVRSRFRRLDPEEMRVVLVESAIRVLPGFAKSLSISARRSLQDLGVKLRLGATVTSCDADGVIAAGKRIPSATVFWAGGVVASPAAAWLDAKSDGKGRVVVAADLSLRDDPDIFVIGDTAHVEQDGRPLPSLASVVRQQADHVGRVLRARIAGKQEPRTFRYRDAGSFVTIGHKSAVVQMGALRFSGRLAWLLWSAMHVYPLLRSRNRTAALLEWSWAYAMSRLGTRSATDKALLLLGAGRTAFRSAGREPETLRLVDPAAA